MFNISKIFFLNIFLATVLSPQCFNKTAGFLLVFVLDKDQ